MRISTNMVCLLVLSLVSSAYAFTGILGEGPRTYFEIVAMKPDSKSSDLTALQTDRWYVLTRKMKLKVNKKVDRESVYNIPDRLRVLTLGPGVQLTVLRYSANGRFALLGIDENISVDNPGVRPRDPVIAWVPTADLLHGFLKYSGEEQNQSSLGINDRDLGESYPGWSTFGDISDSPHCLRDVHVTSVRLNHKSAPKVAMASTAFPKYKASGWLSTPYSANSPLGTVCFFRGGRSCGKGVRCGHAAIKIGDHKWKGAGIWPTPFLRSRRDGGRVPYKFQGCLVPPRKKSAACEGLLLKS
jgi:hypothetical protein